MPSGTRSGNGDELNELVWTIVTDAVRSAHGNKPRRYRQTLVRLDTDVPQDWQPALVVAFLLRLEVLRLTKTPGVTLDQLVDAHSAAFTVLTGRSSYWMKRTLRAAIDFSGADQEVRGDLLIVLGTAALALLLDDPDRQLGQMRPVLEDYMRRDPFHDDGQHSTTR